MQIYPTVELQDGRCVSLSRGDLENPAIWHVDPVETARGFAEKAGWVHITDFDAVARSETDNSTLIEQIIRTAPGSVQLGGGMGTMDRITRWIEAGAGRVVIGQTALVNPDLVKEAALAYPDQIVLALDVYQGKVMSRGWRDSTVFDPLDVLGWFETDALAAIVVTDIDADMEDEVEASVSLITRVAEASRTPVIARGTVRTLDDISTLKYVPQVAGTVIGRALFNKTIDLQEAVALAAPEPEETVAPFV
ncbi:MAG: 1-(5-phosphoribosyl)-5-[(5-phosphoribosylamino)methylideneamino] imidazole-4-carboxamide isomerase [Salibaculum sp.]|jgi:phosphoribosylformimino-5-aminoimidazole carboxamide ribotide isomerase|uniref:1-(5-phosphoribosyl)-5-[(5- phosphoribosylamino)methylideneamino]imidazole-4- carboxamide isomerase n=1 Tax=Roseovarius halophilus (ex Wu et al. 2025) TaxID=3376060 RepID=UPI00286FC051|nr:1-(5-phosphoribosyl)-5-[(5-phosphoribosylamino)methylideneamino] imidazole-4-carboxamide isomerase [Salibaculum sp.]MDR9426498.1 1-(5-phosphoribosyl)-5-[(5-phosphoribosylamino)methylideneamino] imidazole-4-carboxamide isomerase [Salibaculum sp.]MDR9481159.1 1-(5-phosphoribosyl)-5-[(5-phosphoribosylamino)methylideneamino] imidazole-4-carboxamide isomerase [Salibaculum sp.]